MAGFDVHYTRGDEKGTDLYHDGSTYHFNEVGLLVTDRPDGARTIYAHGGWTHLEDFEGADARREPVINTSVEG